MKLNLATPIRDFKGEQLSDEIDKEGMTLQSVLVRSALFVEKGKNPTGAEKLEAYRLAQRLAGVLITDLTIEEAALLKAKVGAMWTPLVVGRVFELMEGQATPLHVADSPR